MSFDKSPNWFRDIIGFIDEIDSYVAGMSYHDFSDDRRTIRAVERCLQNITEASIRIGEESWRVLVPNVAHHRVRGLGNRLRHEYERIDTGSIYDLIGAELPLLRAACLAALDNQ
jgi:uncharacterized protein with HEPN domain